MWQILRQSNTARTLFKKASCSALHLLDIFLLWRQRLEVKKATRPKEQRDKNTKNKQLRKKQELITESARGIQTRKIQKTEIEKRRMILTHEQTKQRPEETKTSLLTHLSFSKASPGSLFAETRYQAWHFHKYSRWDILLVHSNRTCHLAGVNFCCILKLLSENTLQQTQPGWLT